MNNRTYPGPWRIEPLDLFEGGTGIQIVAANDEVVADNQTYYPQELDPEIAPLIAAAPELLEALQWFVENDDTNIGMAGNEFWEDGLNAGIAAIAKATKEIP